MFHKRYPVVGLLLITAVVSCTRYPLESLNDRQKNEEIAITLHAPLEAYFADHNAYPEELSLLTPDYTHEIPTTAAGNKFQYRTFGAGQRREEFSIYWYERSLRDNDIMGCTVRRMTSGNGEIMDFGECWDPDLGKH